VSEERLRDGVRSGDIVREKA